MQDRLRVRGALWRGMPIEVVVEDGFDRAVGPRADIEGALGGGFHAHGAVGAREPNDAQTGAKALLGMRTRFEDQFAQRRRRRADQARVGANALDRPVRRSGGGWTACARGRSCACDCRWRALWAAIRSPLRKISTVRAVSRASTSARAKR